MRRLGWKLVLSAAAVATLGGVGCDDDEAEGGVVSGEDVYEDHRAHFDMLERAHLADIDHQGTFIDFGTPARMKYTIGQWRTGWLADEEMDGATVSYAGDTARLFFEVDRAGPVVIRLRAAAIGGRNVQTFLNGHQQPLLRLEAGETLRDYDIAIPAEHVEAGENYLMFRFGGTRQFGTLAVAAAVDSIRIVPGASIPAGEYHAPIYGELVRDVTVGGASRSALALRNATRLSWYLDVPRGASIGLGVGVADGSAGKVTVAVTPEGGQRTVVWEGDAGGEWVDRRIDLGRFGGKIARLDLSVSGGGAGTVAIASPRILVPEREEEEEAPRLAKNVVVLLVDTTRADKLRPFNPRSRVQTPVLDSIAAESAVFLAAQSPENWTKPSVASILTGLYPATHGVKETDSRVPDSATLLSEHLHANGFTTGTFVANGYVSDRFGFNQGWDRYTNFMREEKDTDAANVLREAGDFIEANRSRRFFVYIQTIDPHVPYDPPADCLALYDPNPYSGSVTPRETADLLERAKRNQITFDARDRERLEALHDGQITHHDREMGRFIERLRRLDVWDDTLFVLTSDHGEEFADHGSWGHGHTTFQELLHVPLLVRLPGSVPASRIEATVSTLDIPATVTDAAGVPAMPSTEGRSVLAFARGAPPPGPAVAFSDFLDDRRVIRAGRYKLELRGINATLWDLGADPKEQREADRHAHPIAMRYLRIHLGQFLGATDRARWMDAQQGAGVVLSDESAAVDATLRGQLQAMGYTN